MHKPRTASRRGTSECMNDPCLPLGASQSHILRGRQPSNNPVELERFDKGAFDRFRMSPLQSGSVPEDTVHWAPLVARGPAATPPVSTPRGHPHNSRDDDELPPHPAFVLVTTSNRLQLLLPLSEPLSVRPVPSRDVPASARTLGTAVCCLPTAGVTLQPPSVTLQPPSVALHPPSVTLQLSSCV